MTRATNARLAGLLFLLYIATGIAAMILFSPVDRAQGTAAKLASIAEHAPRVRLGGSIGTFSAHRNHWMAK